MMISDEALEQSIFTNDDENELIWNTPNGKFSCHHPLPQNRETNFQTRELYSNEVALIQHLRDDEGYKNLLTPFVHCPDFSVGEIIAMAIARYLNYATTNKEDLEIVSLSHPSQSPHNHTKKVEIGHTYDLITECGIATVMVLDTLNEPEFVREETMSKVMVLSDIKFFSPKLSKIVTQFSVLEVSSHYLVPFNQYNYH